MIKKLWSLTGRKSIKFIVFIVSTLLLMYGATYFVRHTEVQRWNTVFQEKLDRLHVSKTQEKAQEQVYREKLVQWAYDNSQRTSRDMIRLTVDEVMTTEHPILILAIITAESEFNPTAVSNKGAVGLGQIMYSFHGKSLKDAGIIKEQRDLFNIQNNIRATNHILLYCLRQTKGDPLKAFELYLGGKDRRYIEKIVHSFLYVSMIKKEPIT